ncbi:MAG: asparagine synthase B [Treponema sp.]|nr:asparagine synthase B [Treponema sp.]
MCGFVGAFDLSAGGQPIDDALKAELRKQILEQSKTIRHRGPDWSGVYAGDNAILSHERLAIVDPLSGKQPLVSDDGKIILAVNGEIYNHKEIRAEFEGKYNFKTQSDCEVIIPLYKTYGTEFLEKLSGIFAFALYDSEKDAYLIGRDEIGVIPLYQGWDKLGRYYVASELKALEGYCTSIEEFPNGHYLYSKDGKPVRWYKRDWESFENVKDNPKATDDKGEIINPSVIEKVKNGLEQAVKQQLMSDVPYGVLLSGGLDSSIIAAITQKFSKKRVESDGKQGAWWPQLHSFAIGLEDSPDLVAARKAAEYIGTIHHEVHFTIQEAKDALRDVIYHIETYDITTVRASTPMYLLARVIKSMGIKMVLSGEGSDELFGGYLYFHCAPNAKEFHEELVRKMSKLHLYDCLRANKSLMAWGVEGRVPFLDKDFIDIAMSLNPTDKMSIMLEDGNPESKNWLFKMRRDKNDNHPEIHRIEQWILRKAFEDMLPPEIAWRQKEQFSDGVGYSWINELKRMTDEKISDAEFERRATRFPINPPKTKEEYYYREIYSELFPSDSAAKVVPHEASIACSTETASKWVKDWKKAKELRDREFAPASETTEHDEPSGILEGIHL